MKRICAFLLALVMLLSLVGCGEQTTPMSESEQSEAAGPVTDEPAAEEKVTYKVGDVVDFGAYKWRVLDVQDNKALLLTDEIIALAVVLTIDAVTESKGGVSVSVSSN